MIKKLFYFTSARRWTCEDKEFQNSQYIGDPINTVGIFNDLAVDELIIQDISIDYLKNENINFKTLKSLASECLCP